jgi:2-amino-4-hydroxy-6-hydroxymethyldihydropteridine diphosphokinase
VVKVYFLLGGNLGDRLATLQQGLHTLSDSVGPVLNCSSIYETEPWGKQNQPTFLNQTALLETELSPHEILKVIKRIEQELKRKRYEKWGSRTIDIDILFYGDHLYEDEDLTIPHPALHTRNFTLVPLMEIASELKHPRFELTIRELYDQSPDPLGTNLYKSAQDIQRP